MNSAALPIVDRLNDPHWNDVRRTYRRICVLRAAGRPAEALDLEIDDLPKALAAAREASGADPETEAAILAQETERVANAAVLAELVAPLLAERLHAQAPAAAPATAASPRVTKKSPAISVPVETSSRSSVSTPPSIADLLDGMLAQGAGAPP